MAYLALKATNLLLYSIPFRIPFGYVAKASFVVFVLLTQSTFIQYLNSFIEQLSLPTLRHRILYSHLITRFRWTNFPSATCMKFKDGREKQKPQIGRPWSYLQVLPVEVKALAKLHNCRQPASQSRFRCDGCPILDFMSNFRRSLFVCPSFRWTCCH